LRTRRMPLVEHLEGRQLMTASLAPLSNLSVPAQLGYQLSLDGSGNTDGRQTYTVTSSNPAIQVSVAQGPYWTLNVSHTASSQPGDISFSGSMTFQLFQDMTPVTVSNISKFTNDGWYNGKNFSRVANNFPGPTDYIAQAGAANPDGSGTSPYPNFISEIVQQLAFTGTGQLAMANAGPNTNNTQFFITTGTPTSLDFGYTVFGQIVSGTNILADITQVTTQNSTVYTNPNGTPEKSFPVSPININSATLSDNNVNGVIHIDTTSAQPGATSTITVTATDPVDGSTKTESFLVTVTSYTGPASPPINFVPFANPVNSATSMDAPVTVQLSGRSGFPTSSTPGTLSYSLLSQPAHGTVSQFNPSTGTLVYTPDSNYLGPDSFTYQVTSTGPKATPAQTVSLPATVNITVGAAHTGAVRVINNVLVVQPPPSGPRSVNNVFVTQQADSTVTGGEKIVVVINGIPDATQPPSLALNQIIVYGTRASTRITIDPSVELPATLSGGHGRRNVVQGGGGYTLEHGWFGHTLLVGGTGPNYLYGSKGTVRFKPSSATVLAYAGAINFRRASNRYKTTPPSGTFYRFARGRLIPVVTVGD
jgi:cyclophilin family peptidyl-prolyl cis-trans isomerase